MFFGYFVMHHVVILLSCVMLACMCHAGTCCTVKLSCPGSRASEEAQQTSLQEPEEGEE